MKILEPLKESMKIVFEKVPTPAVFSSIHKVIRERCTFRPSLREGVRNADLERKIFDEVNKDPKTSTRLLAR